MTTFYQFLPNNFQAPSFMPTFDNVTYKVTIIWNISAKRYYVLCQTLDGNLVFLVPLVATSIAYDITSLTYDEQNSRVVGTLNQSRLLSVGEVFNANIKDTIPIGYSGYGIASVLSDTQFYYNLSQNPGLPTIFGSLEILISITQGYFKSTMVYRNGYFEVNP